MSATLQMGLTGLTIDHARRFERDSREGARRVGFAAKVVNVVRFAVAPLDFVCGLIDRQTQRMADQVVWFQGLVARIESGADLQESEGATTADLLTQLDALQNVLKDVRKNLLTLELQFSQISAESRIGKCVARMNSTLVEVFDAVEAARWAVMEYEADADIAAGGVGKTYTNAADLIADLTA